MSNPLRPRAAGFTAALCAVVLAGLALRAWDLAGAPLLGDDVSAGVSAVNFVERGEPGPTMWHHPRVRDLLVYASRSLAGDGKLGHTLPSLLLGVVAIALTGLLGRRVAGPGAGLLAAALVAADALHVDYSRQAVQEVYTGTFAVAGVLLALRHVDTGRARWLLAAGGAFGLGVAAKWSVAFALAATAACLLVQRLRDGGAVRRERLAGAALVAAALGVLPVTVYLLTWTPWFATGHDLLDWVELQRVMIAEVVAHGGFNPADLELPHRAWQWFVRPVAFADFTVEAGVPVPYIAITNPLVWLATLPAMAALGRRAARSRDLAAAAVVAAFAATYAPLVFTRRPIWVHSSLALLPFAMVAVAALLVRAAAASARARRAVQAWATAAALVAIPLYLLATGWALRIPALHAAAALYRPSFEAESTPAPGRP